MTDPVDRPTLTDEQIKALLDEHRKLGPFGKCVCGTGDLFTIDSHRQHQAEQIAAALTAEREAHTSEVERLSSRVAYLEAQLYGPWRGVPIMSMRPTPEQRIASALQTINALKTRAEQAERERDEWKRNAHHYAEAYAEAERQVREIREGIEALTPIILDDEWINGEWLHRGDVLAALSGVSEPNDEGMESDDRPEPSSPHTAW